MVGSYLTPSFAIFYSIFSFDIFLGKSNLVRFLLLASIIFKTNSAEKLAGKILTKTKISTINSTKQITSRTSSFKKLNVKIKNGKTDIKIKKLAIINLQNLAFLILKISTKLTPF